MPPCQGDQRVITDEDMHQSGIEVCFVIGPRRLDKY